MSNNLVCIKRPEQGLLSSFEEMYLHERLVDVTIFCNDGQLQAHKLVLAACSSYFSNLFDKLANPFHHPVIVLKDMRVDDLKLILEFMYRGQLTLTHDRLSALIKSAESLHVSGLTNSDGFLESGSQAMNMNSHSSMNQKVKRNNKKATIPGLNHVALVRSYQNKHINGGDSSHTERLLQQSMMIDDSIDNPASATIANNNPFGYSNSDTISTRNLNCNSIHTPSPSSIQHLQQLPNIDNHHQNHQQLNSQLQVLSHSLAANRGSSTSQTNANGNQQVGQVSQQIATRGRLHSCNICWKSFREKANLKRHLQVHSVDRVIYACPDCNKTFTWKDNYIRHTKTSHHINNVRTRK